MSLFLDDDRFCASLVEPSHLNQIVRYVADVPSFGCDEKQRKKKYPAVCTEILCSEVFQITDAVFSRPDVLSYLFRFLDSDPSNAQEDERLVVSGCAKVLCSLMQRKVPETLAFLHSIPHCVEKLVNHITNPNVVDFILKFISIDDSVAMQSFGTTSVSFFIFFDAFFCLTFCFGATVAL